MAIMNTMTIEAASASGLEAKLGAKIRHKSRKMESVRMTDILKGPDFDVVSMASTLKIDPNRKTHPKPSSKKRAVKHHLTFHMVVFLR